eukprot:1783723-Rhodomonas_salina.2
MGGRGEWHAHAIVFPGISNESDSEPGLRASLSGSAWHYMYPVPGYSVTQGQGFRVQRRQAFSRAGCAGWRRD